MRGSIASSLAPLNLILQAALPGLSPQGRAIITELVQGTMGARRRSARVLAAAVGLGSRFSLGRLLRRDGLPPLGDLYAWTLVLALLHAAETQDVSLARITRRTDLDARAGYRLIKRLTGRTWRWARAQGFAWALLQFLSHCRPLRTC